MEGEVASSDSYLLLLPLVFHLLLSPLVIRIGGGCIGSEPFFKFQEEQNLCASLLIMIHLYHRLPPFSLCVCVRCTLMMCLVETHVILYWYKLLPCEVKIEEH